MSDRPCYTERLARERERAIRRYSEAIFGELVGELRGRIVHLPPPPPPVPFARAPEAPDAAPPLI